MVVTVKKPIAQETSTWFLRNGNQVVEQQQRVAGALCRPRRVPATEPADRSLGLLIRRRPSASPRRPAPVEAEACVAPTVHSGWLHQLGEAIPAVREPRDHDPQDSGRRNGPRLRQLLAVNTITTGEVRSSFPGERGERAQAGNVGLPPLTSESFSGPRSRDGRAHSGGQPASRALTSCGPHRPRRGWFHSGRQPDGLLWRDTRGNRAMRPSVEVSEQTRQERHG